MAFGELSEMLHVTFRLPTSDFRLYITFLSVNCYSEDKKLSGKGLKIAAVEAKSSESYPDEAYHQD